MRVYNDLTRKKEELIPQVEGQYKIYVCGPTVYDYFHLGNARPFIVFDTLRRYLEYRGNQVTYVQNFTDIDDKVIRRANEEGVSYQDLTDRMIAEYFVDADGLGIKRASCHPRATECIGEIIDLIQTLDDKGYTYVLDDGVYFDTTKFATYGKLSHRDLDADSTVHRVASSLDKRQLSDFVLWKFQKPGEPAWDSPWGKGRPGWHIECSAMSRKYLGDTLDIHGGGQDLIFPHHENEIAQSEAATGKPFVRYWMHNGFINIDNEKMAKSAGNFFTVRDLSKKYPYTILRFFMLQAHYRMPINFTHDLLEASAKGWERIQNALANLRHVAGDTPENFDFLDRTKADFIAAMDDDLNTADAFAAIFNLVRESNTLLAENRLSPGQAAAAHRVLLELLQVLGLDPGKAPEAAIPEAIQTLSDRRLEAKRARDFALADALRDEIQQLGWRVEDTAEGVRLIKA